MSISNPLPLSRLIGFGMRCRQSIGRAARGIRVRGVVCMGLVLIGLAVIGIGIGLLEEGLQMLIVPSAGIAGIGFILLAVALSCVEGATANVRMAKIAGLVASAAVLLLVAGNVVIQAFPVIQELLGRSGLVMTPVSTGAFFLIGVCTAMACLNKPIPRATTWIGLGLVALGSVSLIAHFYGDPLLLFGSIHLEALASAGFLLSGVGLCTLPPAVEYPLRLFCQDTIKSLLLRAFLPTLVGLMIALDLATRVVRQHDLWNPALHDTASTVLVAGVLALVIKRIADRLGRALDKAHADRERAEDQLRDYNHRLEAAVVKRTEELAGALAEVERVVTELHDRERQLIEVSGREQQRLGQELHDQLGQLLTGIGFLSRGVELQLEEDQPVDVEAVTSLRKLAVEAIEQARTLAQTYTPLHLKAHGLNDALADFCAATRKTYGVDCQWVCQTELPSLSPEVQLHLYRIVQEAVTNAVKHGKAPKIRVKTEVSEEGIDLVVANNGRPPESSEKSTGLGLAIMRYRADAMGATLSFQSGDANGFEVRCHLSLQKTV